MSAQVQPNAAATGEVRGQLWKDNLRDYGLLGSLLLIVAFFYFITAAMPRSRRSTSPT